MGLRRGDIDVFLQDHPGKWLLNIRVRRHDGNPLTGAQSLRRAFSVCWRGTFFNLFPFFIIGFVISNLSLTTRGRTPWDLQCDLDVEHGPVGQGQVIAYIIATFAAATALSYIIGPVEVPFNP